MKCIEQSIQVAFRYPIHFISDLFDSQNPLFAQCIHVEIQSNHKLLFIIDSGVTAHHPELPAKIEKYLEAYPRLSAAMAPPLIVPGGEAAKNDPQHLQAVYEAIQQGLVCRHSYIAAIGGGAVLDLAGYAAATAHRGIRLIRIPTTVLAQNDSGVGVKNGINAFGKKNFIGAFAPPHAVLNDWKFLKTLEQRDWLAGISEAVKVALIKDAAFFEFIRSSAAALVSRDMPLMQRLIYRCAQLHLDHIASSGDPFESGSARPLDFGHWAAHKLEQMTNFQLRHGEAVAIGIALDVTYSGLIGSLAENDVQTVCHGLEALNLPLFHDAMRDSDTLFEGLEEFREHLGGRLTITLLRRIGQGHEVHEIDPKKMALAVEKLAHQAGVALN